MVLFPVMTLLALDAWDVEGGSSDDTSPIVNIVPVALFVVIGLASPLNGWFYVRLRRARERGWWHCVLGVLAAPAFIAELLWLGALFAGKL